MNRLARGIRAVAACSLAATVLNSCTHEPETRQRWPLATVRPLAVPDSMRLTQPKVDIGQLIPGSAGLPWLIGGSYAEPGQSGAPAVWLSDDANIWSKIPISDAVEGDFDGWAEGGTELTALAGSVWRDGMRVNKLWTSTDRRQWHERTLPQALTGGTEITDLSVDGTSVLLLGSAVDGKQTVLRLDADDNVSAVPLPTVGPDEQLDAWELVAAGNTVILLATTGPEGATTAPVLYHSSDSGANWSPRARLTDNRGYFGGITRTDDGFVLVGSVRADSSPSAPPLPAAWHSVDGASWLPERVPAAPEDLRLEPASGVSLRSPIAADGTVTALAHAPDAAVAGMYRRHNDGSWELVGTTGDNAYSGAKGSIVARPDGSIIGVIDDGGVRIGRLTADRTWTDVQQLSRRAVPFGGSLVLDPDRRLVRTGRSVWQVHADGTTSRSGEFMLVSLHVDAAVKTEWLPREAGSLHGTLTSIGPGGIEVVLGSAVDLENSSVTARGWWRSPLSTDWHPVSGFDPTTTLEMGTLGQVGNQWMLTAHGRPNIGFTTRGTGQIWSSTDGTSWQQMPVRSEGELSSRIAAVCAGPNSKHIAVGWVEQTPGTTVAAAWGLDGQWQRLNLGAFDDFDGSLSGCAAGPFGFVVDGTIDGRSAVLQSATGDDWQKAVVLGRGESLADITARPSGFIAAGRVQDSAMSAPALWVSRDGRAWNPVRVPSLDSSTARIGELEDGEIAVFLPAEDGEPISVIDDVDGLIAEYGG